MSWHKAPCSIGTVLSLFLKQSFAILSAKSVHNYRTESAETLSVLPHSAQFVSSTSIM